MIPPQYPHPKIPLLLFVEDDTKDMDLVTVVLAPDEARNLYRTAFSRDAVEALAFVHERHGELAAVMIDLKMPKMTGLELAQQIRAFSRIPIVILSSSNHQRGVDACYGAGVNAYVVKPIDFRTFENVLQVIARFWATINSPGNR